MVGQNIGKYRVLDRIGRGGMGTVYRAIDETLHRDVAIKVLNAELNDPEVAKRFRAEAITVARLSHPGIATIYELFQHDGQWLMVMEFVRGETLEHMVDRMGPLSPQRTAELCMQTLAALAHAHSMGVVHRDLKPANIMITETGAIKVMDFGIARVAGTEHLTSAGFMMGTPAYMAPEQVMGHEIDARADLYAMGVVFYRLTTAKLPFKGDTPFAMAQSQVNDPPTPIGVIRADLPPWVEQVVVRALAKNPDERFQSAVEFHEGFARSLAGLPMTSMYTSSAPTELLMTPPRAMVSGALPRPTMPPLTGLPAQPSGPQPLTGPPGGALPPSSDVAPPMRPATGEMPLSAEDTPTVMSVSSGAVPVLPPPSVQASGGNPAPLAPRPVEVASSVSTAASGTAPNAAAAKAQPPKVPAAVSTKKKASGALIGVAAVLVVAAIGGTFWVMSRQSAPPPVAEVPAPVPEPVAALPPEPAPETVALAAPAPAAPVAPVPRPATTSESRAATTSRAGAAASAAAPSAPTAAGRGTTAPVPEAPVVDDTHQAFTDVKLLLVNGRKANDEDVILNFVNGEISVMGKKSGKPMASVRYNTVQRATFVHARDPKWDPAYHSPPENLDVGGMLRTAKNWLVLQSQDSYMILRLDGVNWRNALTTLEARTTLSVLRPQSNEK